MPFVPQVFLDTRFPYVGVSLHASFSLVYQRKTL